MAKKTTKRASWIDAAVGRNVRVWRMARGMTQEQLAGRVGVTFQQLQKYEIGGNRIPTGRLVKLPASSVFRFPRCSRAPTAPSRRARCWR
jgi:DNA-binding XRE family transcriptional regulator